MTIQPERLVLEEVCRLIGDLLEGREDRLNYEDWMVGRKKV